MCEKEAAEGARCRPSTPSPALANGPARAMTADAASEELMSYASGAMMRAMRRARASNPVGAIVTLGASTAVVAAAGALMSALTVTVVATRLVYTPGLSSAIDQNIAQAFGKLPGMAIPGLSA